MKHKVVYRYSTNKRPTIDDEKDSFERQEGRTWYFLRRIYIFSMKI